MWKHLLQGSTEVYVCTPLAHGHASPAACFLGSDYLPALFVLLIKSLKECVVFWHVGVLMGGALRECVCRSLWHVCAQGVVTASGVVLAQLMHCEFISSAWSDARCHIYLVMNHLCDKTPCCKWASGLINPSIQNCAFWVLLLYDIQIYALINLSL